MKYIVPSQEELDALTDPKLLEIRKKLEEKVHAEILRRRVEAMTAMLNRFRGYFTIH